MIIVNTQLQGESTYDVTIGQHAIYRVSAFDLLTALDRLADYIETHSSNLYTSENMIKLAAMYSSYKDAEAYAVAHNLVRCGTNGIYLEITSIKGCPNG